MSNALTIFNYGAAVVRTVEIEGEPWFVATDVCKILDHSNTTMAMNMLDLDEKAKLSLGLPGGKTNVISESGLYTLILRSDKQEAIPFRRWVTKEVLPMLRKTGSYSVAPPQTREEKIASALLLSQEIIAEKDEKIGILTHENLELQDKIEEDAPKVDFFNTVGNSKGTLTFTEVGKLHRITSMNICEFLRQTGWLFKRNDVNLPVQKYMDKGYFVVIEVTYGANNRKTLQTRVTGKGEQAIAEHIKKSRRFNKYWHLIRCAN